ncbi:MAG: four helix bundle protein [Flavobacteriales bacterium]|jgi:four helix bundle protein
MCHKSNINIGFWLIGSLRSLVRFAHWLSGLLRVLLLYYFDLGYLRMKDFTELEVWKVARKFKNEMFIFCKSLPLDEKFRLKDQLIQSSRSVTVNIAEGYGRFLFQENIQFCRIARGSLSESKEHLITAFDCKLLSMEDYKRFIIIYESCLKLLNGYINYLKKMKKEN